MNKKIFSQIFVNLFIGASALVLTACPSKKIRPLPTQVQPHEPSSSDQGGGNGNGGADFIEENDITLLNKSVDDPVFIRLEKSFNSSSDIDPCQTYDLFKQDVEYFYSTKSGKNKKTMMIALIARGSSGCLGFSIKSFPGETDSTLLTSAAIDLIRLLQYPGSGKRAAMRVSGNIYLEEVSIPEGAYVDGSTGAKILISTIFEYAHSLRITEHGNLIVKTDIYIRHSNGIHFVDRYYTLLGGYSPLEHMGTSFVLSY